jgi:hypothetical protein
MRIVAFLHDSKEISSIMRSLDIPAFKPPEPMGRGPPSEETFENLPFSDDIEYF